MDKVLLKWKKKSDEEGFLIVTYEEYLDWKTYLENKTDLFSLSYGSYGDYLEYNNGLELLEEIEVSTITESKIEVIFETFGVYGFGYTDFYENVLDISQQEMEEEDLFLDDEEDFSDDIYLRNKSGEGRD
jgi:hypothetical protein